MLLLQDVIYEFLGLAVKDERPHQEKMATEHQQSTCIHIIQKVQCGPHLLKKERADIISFDYDSSTCSNANQRLRVPVVQTAPRLSSAS